jgi:(p)ppGpp synthase/HD superfamily hydrolase
MRYIWDMDEVSPGYLMTLPLHAVTEVYHTEGLRKRFLLEAAALGDDERIGRALTLAERLHKDDLRVREPYVNHVLRVATRIIHHYRVTDADVVIAGLLHDTAEDHPAELAGGEPADPRQAAFGVLARDFGPRVAELVEAVTNPMYAPDRDKDEQYREHVATSLAANPWARVIKASDFTDNGVGIIHTSGPKIRRAATKYQPLTAVLRELVEYDDTPLTAEVKRHIVEQLALADERFAAILRA